MYDPVMRVLTVLEILQARDSVSGAELAERGLPAAAAAADQ
ncbi:hypothetical protein [Terracidiphilus sp.]